MAASAMKWPAGGPDPLEVAGKRVMAEEHFISYDSFSLSLSLSLIRLIRHLHQGQPELPIMLPLVRVGEILGCDSKLISRHRTRAVRQGILKKEVEKYNHLAKKATRFKVLSLPNEAVSRTSPPKAHW
jgi:hypothetical protein